MNINNLSELLARCDGSFIPRTLEDFIGRQMIERQSGDTWISEQRNILKNSGRTRLAE